LRRKSLATLPAIWRWTAVFIHALRHALCPSPGLLALMTATACGDLSIDLNDAPRRREVQGLSLADLLGRWLLG
jgi:hypothetical protein